MHVTRWAGALALAATVGCSSGGGGGDGGGVQCTAGEACTPLGSPNPCKAYATTCASSTAVAACSPVADRADGLSCGAGSICAAGTCTSTAASATVGAAGGVVASVTGARVEVPAGALDGDTVVGVAPSTAAPPAGVGAVGAVYEFTPDGRVFASPVRVTLPLPPGAASVSVYWQRPDKSGFDPVGGTVDQVARTITVETAHFSQAVVGQASATRTVSGTAMVTWISTLDRASEPATVANPPEALVALGQGGYQVLAGVMGTGPAAGTFTIPDVPVGEYMLRFGINYRILETSAPSISSRAGGVPPSLRTAMTTPTRLDLAVTGLAPWQAGDLLEFFAPETNGWDFQTDRWAATAPAVGDTSLALSINTLALNGSFDHHLIEGSKGHRAYLGQLASAVSGGGLPYQAMARLVRLASFDQTDGVTTALDAALADQALSDTTSLDLRFAAWKSALDLDGNPAASVQIVGNGGAVYLMAQPGQAEDGFYTSNADLLILEDASGTDLQTGAMPFASPAASPLTGSWATLARAYWSEAVGYQLAGTVGPAYFNNEVSWTTTLGSLEAAPVLLPISLPRSATINGSGFFTDLQGVGLTPTIAWVPPRIGSPVDYQLSVRRLSATATNRTALTSVASFTTPHTSLTLPPGILVAGNTYVFVLTARGAATGFAGLNEGRGTVSSGQIQP